MAPHKKKRGSAQIVRMRTHKAARLVDKNSRTMVKLMQLLDVMQTPGANLADTDGFITRRIEKLKLRLNRRLIKLSKWADSPEDERQPLVPDPRQLHNMDNNRLIQMNQRLAPKTTFPQSRPPALQDYNYVQHLMKVNNAVAGNNRFGQQQTMAENSTGQILTTSRLSAPNQFQNPRGLPMLGSAYSLPFQPYAAATTTSIDNSNLSAILARQKQVVMETSNVFRNQAGLQNLPTGPAPSIGVLVSATSQVLTSESQAAPHM